MFATTLLALAIASTGQQKIDPGMLVGTWEVVDSRGASKLATVVFGGDGKFRSVPKDRNSSEFPGTYKVEGSTITIEPHSIPIVIKELGEDRLVLDGLGADGGILELKRQRTGTGRAAMRSGGFRLGAAPVVGGRWAVVKLARGDFTVEMPGPPNGRESGGGGGFHETSVSHQGRDMEVVATEIQGPMEFPADQMNKYLEVLRNRAVERYGKDSKVVSEKPVEVGGMTGREFVVSIDRMGAGPMNVSGRVFARGKMSYILLAMPMAKGQALGPDAQKFLDSFGPAGAIGKTTKPSARMAGRNAEASAATSWGEEVDPDADVEVQRSDDSLTMEVPAKAHLLAHERDTMNAPRVLAPVAGDFVVTVQVSAKFRPVRPSTLKGFSSRQAAGLVIWKDEKNYLVFQRRAELEDDQVVHQVVLQELLGGNKGVSRRQPASEGPTFLRLERKGDQIAASFSDDGKAWKPLKPLDAAWLDKEVKVGVIAANTSPTPHAVKFEGYSLNAK